MEEVKQSDYNTVPEAVSFYRERCGEDAPFFVFRDRLGGRDVFTLGRLHRLAGTCAALLQHRGIGKGSVVMVCLDNSPERLVCELGVLYAGAVCVNGLCHMTDGSDLLHCLRHSKASAILLDPDVTSGPWAPLRRVVKRADDGTVTSEKLPYLKHVEFVKRHPGKVFLGQLETYPGWVMESEVGREDGCFVFTTSGTTGLPKLVLKTHGDFVTALEQWTRGVPPSPSRRAARYQDTHLGTSGGNVTVALMLNETRVLCDVRAGLPQDRALFVASCLGEEKCTKATLSPADVLNIRQRYTQPSDNHHLKPMPWLSPLEVVSLGGQPVTSRAVEAALGMARAVMVYYGCTELGLVSVGIVTEGGSFRDYNVGHPLPGVQVKVVDEKTGTPVAAGEIGQVLLKHPGALKDYLHDSTDPSAPQAPDFTADGFYPTGDRGKVNSNNTLTIFGRIGESVILRGSRVCYPHALEAALSTCPGVADVIVVGVPDPLVFEEFCACVVLQEGVSLKDVEKEVEKKVAGPGQTLCPLAPRHYVQFEALPQLYTGRPHRRQIKEIAKRRLKIK
ncbi:3-[(3aS,4S,7aS)-7a-methyl-1,5-dioxo-octahydro-1H-inden-4-yl]propanoyl:CoA ligase-like [Babylonia areolata]|uniref:3-[(3aS,4S,7aS)-7a-methyl-1, 5-dioxo-octahydro-1H-inden-4-yl]propanoyl:CoA ligase-like n=1 Tax=Babylonia areolata TaxID=304850 RepID=UPI003FD43A4E